jgi:protein SCO1/2
VREACRSCTLLRGKTGGKSAFLLRRGEVRPFQPRLALPARRPFVDDSGRPVSLGDLRGRPVILTLFFSSCGYACPLLLGDMMRIRAGLTPEVRDRARLVLVSFDVRRDTPEKLAAFRQQRQLDDGYVLLHADAAGVSELAALLGVKYKEEADGNFAHSNVITVLNPAGEIVHQRLGLRDGLAEAAAAVMLAAQPRVTP